MQGSRTVEPFIASILDTLPVETSSPPTPHTPEPREKGERRVKKKTTNKHHKQLKAIKQREALKLLFVDVG